MRKLLFTASAISLFTIISAINSPKPSINVIEEEDLKNNSFRRKSLALRFETEPENKYYVKVNGTLLDNLYAVRKDPGCTCILCSYSDEKPKKQLKDTDKIRYKIKNLEDHIHEGLNTIEITAHNTRKTATKKIELEIGYVKETILGIDFEMCKKAFYDYKNNSENYTKIAREIIKLNKLLDEENTIEKIIIQYETDESVCFIANVIEKGGSTNAWFFPGEITLGYGKIAFYGKTNDMINTIYHEFGHALHKSLSEEKQEEMYDHYINIKEHHEPIFDLFKDGNYSEDKESGHPKDGPSELFASAFMINNRYSDKFNEKLKELKPEEQEIAKNIIKFVECVTKN